jgi:hemerythrin-like domain-containing protein
MKLTARLQDEHRDINIMLQILEKICAKIERGEKVKKAHLESIMEFFKIFVGECHLAKEEVMLFPVMEKAGVPIGGGPIGELRSVHILARSYITALTEAALNHSGCSRNDKIFLQSAREYIGLLKDHINAEDMLFPLAENYISSGLKQDLAQAFNEFEKNRFAACSQTKYHKIVNRLKDTYL